MRALRDAILKATWWVVTRLGWRFEGEVPDHRKMVILAAPHTSNWDFFMFMGALHAFRLNLSFLAKGSLFKWGFGRFLDAIGGIPVGRGRPEGIVGQAVEAFNAREEMVLLIAPEGTRRRAESWRSGFLHIARGAGVPVLMASVDFPSKTVELGPVVTDLEDSGNLIAVAKEFYGSKTGYRPEWAGPVRLQDL